MFEFSVNSRTRRSPYYEATVDAGVRAFTRYNEMLLPVSYGDPVAEYERLTQGVAIWDVAAERQVEISGPDAFELTNNLSARDLRGMKIGRARYAPLCDHDGRLINDPVVLRIAEDRFWLSLADSQILRWAKAIGHERNAQVDVFEPDVSPLAIQGPRAIDLARDLFGADVVDPLGFFHHTPVEIKGIPLVLCRSGWSKQGGYELFLTKGNHGVDLWRLVMAAGEKYGIGPGAPNNQERIESGLLSYGTDHDADTDPIEAGLSAFTSLDGDHDFVGRQALEERLQRPVRRNVVNVRLHGGFEPCTSPWPLTANDEPFGQLRASTFSTKLQSWLGVAQIATPFDAADTQLIAQAPSGARYPCTVSDIPFGTAHTS